MGRTAISRAFMRVNWHEQAIDRHRRAIDVQNCRRAFRFERFGGIVRDTTSG
jgi:hypothetical protein